MKVRVVFLVGADTEATRSAIEAVCAVQEVLPVAVLMDTDTPSFARRMKNLRRNVRREGAAYIGRRLVLMLRNALAAAATGVVPQAEVNGLLREAFPERSFSLPELGERYGFPVIPAGNLNEPEAIAKLKECRADLGIVLGTRILKKTTFSVPALGCLNLHKGKVPEFRGMPPGFWELYEGVNTAGVTVHFVDEGVDTGDIIGTGEVLIHPRETLDSLKAKLDREGARVLGEAVAQLCAGTQQRRAQPASTGKARTKPTRAQESELYERRPHLRPPGGDFRQIVKTALYLLFFYSGLYGWLRRKPRGRTSILLYHRVNDISKDPLTTSTRVFAEHLVMLRRYYKVIGSSELVSRLERREPLEHGAVVIHFDDCYRDVATEAAGLLKAAGMPATMFISSGFIDTDRVFEHDAAKYPHRFENLRRDDIPLLLASAFEIGAHTVNHVNLGQVTLEQAYLEVTQSKTDLEAITGQPVHLFSFPFGRPEHFQPAVREIVERAGFRALFAASGGVVSAQTDVFSIPRSGASWEHRGLDVMMELEGIAVRDLRIRRR